MGSPRRPWAAAPLLQHPSHLWHIRHDGPAPHLCSVVTTTLPQAPEGNPYSPPGDVSGSQGLVGVQERKGGPQGNDLAIGRQPNSHKDVLPWSLAEAGTSVSRGPLPHVSSIQPIRTEYNRVAIKSCSHPAHRPLAGYTTCFYNLFSPLSFKSITCSAQNKKWRRQKNTRKMSVSAYRIFST